MTKKVAVVAIGGNSLIKDKTHQTVEDQYQASAETAHHIADMIEAGWDVAIGHGNGPQVGFILRSSVIQLSYFLMILAPSSGSGVCTMAPQDLA